ncbi:glycoside hydrolase family 108 protein [Deinococcus humi]|uniref:Lysozyme family protein n=1 Tax=Deinococcus humi TaxID=662880 RepID=A0A7W8JRU2_9DEIO|nr:lysozyme family protein [Deinococcus humi]GGO22307.1 hypothetical protein GCM10008949_09430 [Deinococcus humi]
MTSDFERAHEFTARWEGGLVDHPADPGGRTAYGVTQRVYTAWRTGQKLPARDVWLIREDEVLTIYRTRYWEAYPFPSRLPWPLSAAIYDMAVNHGGGRSDGSNGAGGLLQRAMTHLPNGAPVDVALAACDERETFYRAIVRERPSQSVFLRGWLRRVNAQRVWLRENAAPALPPRVILIDMAGQEVDWSGRPDKYGGVLLDDALIIQLRTVYASPGGPWNYPGLRVWVRRNGDMVLERAPLKPKDHTEAPSLPSQAR